ncbi:MAG: diguanylate cyclase [Gammaproteobacteria bacterium (ex Lamellibrachia satsuma)]|nr:MAG: diguanylate cyclase [Gammaproteobacteria bacterium (ex Lamellibrachia satsuma)]RRS31089.1 MAG: diguanylate cyclase [Gammaproteobacteria bacterium (ex Lamellibrachia satsuma)]RRS36699.1 MAG: diguanylate cyclase [Gammaproteobacteria bacterium (ex Lamellibrachia satsuma)]
MKKQLLVTTLCGAALLFGCSQEADSSDNQKTAAPASEEKRSAILPPTHPRNDTVLTPDVLLTVNGQPVTKPMYGIYFQDRASRIPGADQSQEMQMTVLNELANVLIVAQDAEAKNIDKRPEVAATLALLRAKLLTQTAIQEYVKANLPSDADQQKLYDEKYAGKSSVEYKARHILVKEEEQAKSLITELEQDADFAELAKTHSTGPTGKNGGDLGWFDGDQMVKPFSDTVKTMETGSYTKVPVKTQFGWHVILLEETREQPAPAIESVRKELMTELQQKVLSEYIQGLRAKSKLEFNEQAGLKKREEG